MYTWVPGSGEEVKKLFSLDAGVTAIKWENGATPRLLAACTTDGTLAVFKTKDDNSGMIVKLAIRAHKPISDGPQDLKVR